jgi:nitroreductase
MKKLLILMSATLLALLFGGQVLAQDITLMEPQPKVGLDLLDVIKTRVAAHGFVKRALPLADLSTILWAANGLKGVDAVSGASKAARTIPYSGDNAYVNMYVFTPEGVYLYDPMAKLLKQTSKGDARSSVTVENIPTASLMVLFTYDFAKVPPFLSSMPKLFHDIAVGTASYGAENMMLAAAAFKLGSIVMYNIKPAASFASAANLGKEESPLFIVQLGFLQ